ncbi:nucleoside phosphorylase-I family protein [Portibacter lacus]|uniref:Futalosine hydrolase n=1 Tax=Portibacter lacus TaxID=1099794 RepID=A0AA37WCZ1_9BACT|nr:hypothetical protein [Portibacter lacus]GLR15402.1 hypothetical protein GCM10007940_00170 [Portibacter lacus]
MRILIVSSSGEEINPTLEYMDENWEKISFSEYKKGNLTVFPLVTGYASIFMPYALAKFHGIEDIDYAIFAGLAAGTTRIVEIGQTVNVGRDILGDVGIEESDGTFKDLFKLKFHEPTRFPFFKGEIFNEDIINPLKLRVVKNISVNTIPGTFETIEEINKRYHAEIVTTNGAAFAYSCRMLDVKYLQLRTIYRYLEPTTIINREKEFAIRNLNKELMKLIEELNYLSRGIS